VRIHANKIEQSYATRVARDPLFRRPYADRVICAVLLVLPLVVAACAAKGPSPEKWAGDVCAAMTPWRASIENLTSQAQQAVTATSTAAQTKDAIVHLLAGAEQASEAARQKVAAAGIPDTDGGAEVAAQFAGSLTKARDAYAHARQSVQALSTKNAKSFYDALTMVMNTLSTEYADSAVDPTHLQSAALSRAFAEVPACR